MVHDTGQETLVEAHELSRRMLQVADLTRSVFGALAAEFDLTAVQARAVLRMYEPTPMRALAEHLSCDASNVTGIADRLEQRGFAERVVGSDRRVILLQLTDRGRRTRWALAERVGAGSVVTAKLSPTERRHLGRLLDKMLG
ncbi:MAG: MarR family transcriptional regulator [Actinomycetota bacterium]|nr:MarR family transcriptional regulator [Actinomycetota bacterium]